MQTCHASIHNGTIKSCVWSRMYQINVYNVENKLLLVSLQKWLVYLPTGKYTVLNLEIDNIFHIFDQIKISSRCKFGIGIFAWRVAWNITLLNILFRSKNSSASSEDKAKVVKDCCRSVVEFLFTQVHIFRCFIYIYLVCLSVCLCPINVNTAEPMRPTFWC